MIDVRVTIGVYEDLSGVRVFRMKLGGLPRIGESVILSGEIKEYEKQKKKEWSIPDYEHTNYVKNIAYDGNDTPILMLSIHPSKMLLDFFVKGEYVFSFTSGICPKEDEMITMPESGKIMYVKGIIHKGNGIIYVSLADAPSHLRP